MKQEEEKEKCPSTVPGYLIALAFFLGIVGLLLYYFLVIKKTERPPVEIVTCPLSWQRVTSGSSASTNPDLENVFLPSGGPGTTGYAICRVSMQEGKSIHYGKTHYHQGKQSCNIEFDGKVVNAEDFEYLKFGNPSVKGEKCKAYLPSF